MLQFCLVIFCWILNSQFCVLLVGLKSCDLNLIFSFAAQAFVIFKVSLSQVQLHNWLYCCNIIIKIKWSLSFRLKALNITKLPKSIFLYVHCNFAVWETHFLVKSSIHLLFWLFIIFVARNMWAQEWTWGFTQYFYSLDIYDDKG